MQKTWVQENPENLGVIHKLFTGAFLSYLLRGCLPGIVMFIISAISGPQEKKCFSHDGTIL